MATKKDMKEIIGPEWAEVMWDRYSYEEGNAFIFSEEIGWSQLSWLGLYIAAFLKC